MKVTGRKFGYARVSSEQQDYTYQVKELIKAGVIKELIFADKLSGKDFNRAEYQRVKALLSAGDELYIHAVDRLGRCKEDTKKEFQELKAKGVIVRVLNLPTTLIEVPEGNEAMFDMMNNLLLEVLTTMAEEERKNIKRRQRAGIDSMAVCKITGKRISNKTGNAVGRPSRQFPEGWEEAYKKWKAKKLTAKATIEKLNLTRNTFYNLVKDYEEMETNNTVQIEEAVAIAEIENRIKEELNITIEEVEDLETKVQEATIVCDFKYSNKKYRIIYFRYVENGSMDFMNIKECVEN